MSPKYELVSPFILWTKIICEIKTIDELFVLEHTIYVAGVLKNANECVGSYKNSTFLEDSTLVRLYFWRVQVT